MTAVGYKNHICKLPHLLLPHSFNMIKSFVAPPHIDSDSRSRQNMDTTHLNFEINNRYYLYNGQYQVAYDSNGLRKTVAHGLGKFNVYLICQDGQLQKEVEYRGEVESNMFNGFGALTKFDDQGRKTSVLVGTFRDNQPQGYMNVAHFCGDKYYGCMQGAARHALGRTVFGADSPLKMERGFYWNNMLQGYGTREWKNGNVYNGYFAQGVFEGHGVVTLKCRGIVVEGTFRNGKIVQGSMASQTQEWTYVGHFTNEKREGLGKLTTKNYTFEGMFVRGLPSVHCSLTTNLTWMQAEWAEVKQLFCLWKSSLKISSEAGKRAQHMFCTKLLSFWSKAQKLNYCL